MKRRYLRQWILTGWCLVMAASPALAAGQAVMPPGKSLRRTPPSISPSGQTLPAEKVPPKEDIRDIRGPLHIPDPVRWLYYAGGTFLLLAVAAGAWRWFRRRKTLLTKHAFEIAFEQLEQAKSLMKPELADAFSIAVSDAVRTYIEKRFQVRITRSTTEEFMARIKTESAGELVEYGDLLGNFLEQCDLAKFARCLLAVDQMKAMHRSAWEFVDKTRPRPEEEPVAQKSDDPEGPQARSRATGGHPVIDVVRRALQKITPGKPATAGGLHAGNADTPGGG